MVPHEIADFAEGHRHCPEAHRRPQDENQNVTLLAHRESHELQEPPEMV
jgi:hypothetical protein